MPSLARLVGVNAGPWRDVGAAGSGDDGDVVADEYEDIGVSMVRTHDFYDRLDVSRIYRDFDDDPDDPLSFDFAASDEAYRAIVDNGFNVYLRIGESFSDPIGSVRLPDTTIAGQWENWLGAVMNIVRHYMNDFDNDVPFTKTPSYVELWNEPDSPRFWTLDPGRFVEFFVVTVSAINSEYSSLKVGGAGFTDGASESAAGWVDNFVDAVIGYSSVPSRAFDFLSWHVYDRDPERYREAADYYEARIDELVRDLPGMDAVESHITEWNTTSPDPDSLRSRGRGAAEMTAAWIVLQEEEVDQSCFYRGMDTHQSTGDPASSYGLWTIMDAAADIYEKKAIGHAFKLWSEFAGHTGDRLHVTTKVGASSGFYALARYSGTGECVVLMANLSGSDHAWEVALPNGGAVAEAADITVKEIDEGGVYQEPSVSMPMAIRANTVQLVLIDG